jgi:hypothetical protein
MMIATGVRKDNDNMTLLDAWKHSEVDAASYDFNGLQITVICKRLDMVNVIIGTSTMKPFSPEDFGAFCRILGIDPEKNWQPVNSFAVGI